jgi:nitrate/nitrite transporter NarK
VRTQDPFHPGTGLPLFNVGFIALFVLSGIGNGSTYKMIPAIFRSKGQLRVAAGVDPGTAAHDSRRMANAVIGIAGATGRPAACWSTSRSGNHSWAPGPGTPPTSGSSRST